MTSGFTRRIMCLAFVSLGVLSSISAYAGDNDYVVRQRPAHKVDPIPGRRDDDDDDDRRGHRRHDHHDRDKNGNIVIRGYTTIYVPAPGARIIVLQDQQILVDYLRQNVRSGYCPPGVLVSDSGCVPQNYVRRYFIGSAVQQGVVLEPLPPFLATQLHPPYGYQYGQIDNDIVLINVQTGRIVDAVTLINPVY